MKRVATTPDPDAVGIPLVVRMPVVRVQPHVIVIMFEVEQLEVAVGVRVYAHGHPEHRPSACQ